jgi:hypothetical protein
MSENAIPVSSEAMRLLAQKDPIPPTIYDPKMRTPSVFKAPEQQICPHCGQVMPSDVRQLNNTMNEYINMVGAKVAMMETADSLDIRGVTFYRVTGQDGNGKSTSKFIPVPEPVKSEVAPPVTPIPGVGIIVDVPKSPINVQSVPESVPVSGNSQPVQQANASGNPIPTVSVVPQPSLAELQAKAIAEHKANNP